MPTHIAFADLLEYTDWERSLWREWLAEQGPAALGVGVGPHGDGRFSTVGELVRHIFSAETRYVERLSGLPVTDTGTVPADRLEALFELGGRSRAALRAFIASCPAERWDTPEDLQIGAMHRVATPRKVVVHVLLHEMRHWSQIATLLRLSGRVVGFRDFLFSPALDAPRGEPGHG